MLLESVVGKRTGSGDDMAPEIVRLQPLTTYAMMSSIVGLIVGLMLHQCTADSE